MRKGASIARRSLVALLASTVSCARSGVAPRGDAAVDAEASAAPCPNITPPDGGACDAQALVCEYGNDPNRECRTFAECDPNRNCRTVDDCAVPARWTVTVTEGGACPSTAASACPSSADAASGAPCAEKDAWCAWPDGGTCLCTNCRPGPIGPNCADSATWECTYPQAGSGCPATMPRAGDPCTPPSPTEPLLCEYGCMFGARRCQGGVWLTEPGLCPQSKRAAKRDIQYLGPDDIERLAAETTRLRLATYAYRNPAHGAGRRLGFIIDDAPNTPAVNGDTVDLYGFASMLLATSQAQARKIAALEREVARLRRTLPRGR